MELVVFDPVIRTPEVKVLSGKRVLKYREYQISLLKQMNTQYCASGFEQIKDIDKFEPYSPIVMM